MIDRNGLFLSKITKNIHLIIMTMKKIKFAVLLVVIAFITSMVYAQEQEMKYIFGNQGKTKVSGFIAPIMEYSAMGNNFAFFMGGGGAILLNQTVYFGAYGEGLTTQYKEDIYYPSSSSIKTYYNEQITFGHGGFWMGYIHHSQDPIHAGISTKLGWGSIYPYNYGNKTDYSNECRDNVFVIIPQLEAEFNFFKWLKMNVGLGYRFVTGIDKKYYNSDQVIYDKKDFSKPEATMTLMFGFFK
jgi:hypothetical protein